MTVPLFDILDDLTDEDESGDLVLNRVMSVGELQKAMEDDSVEFDELKDEDFREFLYQLQIGYSSILVQVLDEQAQHFKIVDRGEHTVSVALVKTAEDNGYTIVDSGTNEFPYKDGNTYTHAWAEFQAISGR